MKITQKSHFNQYLQAAKLNVFEFSRLLSKFTNFTKKCDFWGDFQTLCEGLHSGIDHFQRSAQQEISKLKPWAKNLEREMKPAMARVEEEFDSALDKFGFSFGQDRVDSHIMDTTGST